MPKQTLTIAGQQIAVTTTEGTGTPIVLVHGNSASSAAFKYQLEGSLGETYRLIAFDLPGHGESAPATDPAVYSLPGYADIIYGVAEALGALNGVFVGWSLGGHAVLEAVAKLPDAQGFVIFGTPPIAGLQDMATAFMPHPTNGILYNPELSEEESVNFATSFFQEGYDVPPQFIEGVRKTDGAARANLGGSVVAGNFTNETEIVKNMTQPLAILHGEKELLINGDFFTDLEMPTLWRSTVQVIPDAGHTPQWENPDAFNQLITEFVTDSGS
jgi:pimeloyl-ACP methyl ester carboxylesterase